MNSRSLPLRIAACALLWLCVVQSAHATGGWPFDPRRPIVPDARPLALGEAYRAVANGNGALWYNPAGLAFFPTYSIEANYSYGSWVDMHQVSASVVDTKTNPYAGAGAAYIYAHGGKDPLGTSKEFSYHGTRLGLCFPLIENTFALGVGLQYMNSNVQGGRDDNFFTADVSLMARLADFIALAVVGHNLTNTASPSAPLALGAGLALYPFDALLLAFDLVTDFQTKNDPALEYHAGVEYQFLFGEGEGTAQAFALRAGYFFDDVRDRHMVSGGAAYVNPTGAIEFSFRTGVAGDGTDSDEDQIYSLALKLFM